MKSPDTLQGDSNIPFKAETRQLLDILIHSLYTEKEIFLRELISNAADALTRMNFEMLTNRSVAEPDVELAIWISSDPEKKTLVIRDSGIGMTREELAENLGTIAHSGARAFLQAAKNQQGSLSEIIGQFGVGFYSAFMVADWIEVSSRSCQPSADPAIWKSDGGETYSLQRGDQKPRGTVITIKLKDDCVEFAQEYRLQQIIRKHSDYVSFPIYLGKENKQANLQTALWRTPPREVEPGQYRDFYQQLTFDPEAPITQVHLAVDAPVQVYAILFVPSTSAGSLPGLSSREGIRLFAHKVLIQEDCKDLLPDYFRFIKGVVDSEDLSLNVSRELLQSTQVKTQLKDLITSRLIDGLKKLAEEKPEEYIQFWDVYGRYIKEGIASGPEKQIQDLQPLLRFTTLQHPEGRETLEGYCKELRPGQEKVYFLLGEDNHSILHSPHLEVYKKMGVDVLLFWDPLDAFMLTHLTSFGEHSLVNAMMETPPITPTEDEVIPSGAPEEYDPSGIIFLFKDHLGERVLDVRATARLVESVARLVDKVGAMNPELQKMYRLLNRPFEAPPKVLEINLAHPILIKLASLPPEDTRIGLIIEQVYDNALLVEGIHPDPGGMVSRIQQLMQKAME